MAPPTEKLSTQNYADLRRIAAAYLARERRGHTLQPTALVNEAWLRVPPRGARTPADRRHALALAARAMRHALVDHARARAAAKRGGGARRVPLAEAVPVALDRDPWLVALDEALEQLAGLDAGRARVVELRFFGGCTLEETAEIMQVSRATVARQWRHSRAWLQREMSGKQAAPGAEPAE